MVFFLLTYLHDRPNVLSEKRFLELESADRFSVWKSWFIKLCKLKFLGSFCCPGIFFIHFKIMYSKFYIQIWWLNKTAYGINSINLMNPTSSFFLHLIPHCYFLYPYFDNRRNNIRIFFLFIIVTSGLQRILSNNSIPKI